MRLWGQLVGHHGGIREPAVAGRFYPGRADRLAEGVDRYVADARGEMAARGAGPAGRGGAGGTGQPPLPKGRLVAVVVPHAGHVYSGPTAGFAYASIDPALIDRVVLLGPAHFVPVDGIGLSTATAWRTPLGDVPLDPELAEDLQSRIETVLPADDAHAPEHSLEVQVPFLQRVLADRWRLCPLIVGADLPGDVAAVITLCVGLPRTLVVVSTDLSHYLDYSSAVAQDARTIRSIVHRRPDSIGTSDACGRHPLRGLLTAAAAQDWSVRLLDARNSGDTAGDRDRVVGYAAFAVHAAAPTEPTAPGSSAAGSTAAGSTAATAATAASRPDPPVLPGGQDPDTGVRSAPDVVRIAPESRTTLLRLARATIEEALSTHRRHSFDADRWSASDPVLREPGAAFVTLRSASGDLLGCIGSLAARQPLVADVAEHAFDAAFRDPRFPPMTRERAHGMVIDISVLSPTRPFPCTGYDDLLDRVPVGRGLVVAAGRHRATFLPAVWEQLPDPRAFLAALWRKAGLAPGQWPDGTTIEVYDSEEFAEA
ncbi:MAG: AmmeMemoRadiSam system protein B [Candidatus Nanopelagicales bacterium]|nr:AmmeMemoRadiSam system protein B [Candidatus Nanopelagicales bacterium]